MPVVYSFSFRRVPIAGASHGFRPILDVRLRGPSGAVLTKMLVDSGADCPVIAARLARRLGLTLEETTRGRGIAGRVPAWRSRMIVEIHHHSGWLTPIEVPVEVPARGAPPIDVLGREGFFAAYDILFRLGPVPERGVFVVAPHGSVRRVFPKHATRFGRGRKGLAG
ncbi:MAG: retropepsin-like aspartic protease [Candidatus Thermoplasmatota archaeon]